MPYTPGQTVYSADGYTLLTAGHASVPLLITAGHGGWRQPANIPQRTYAACGSGSDPFKIDPDPYTVEQVNNLAWKFEQLYSLKPWTIIFELHRNRCDVNRGRAGGACGSSLAGAAWDQYHGRIAEILTLLSANGQRVCYLDVHGHGEAAQRCQIGLGLDHPEATAANLDDLGPASSLANWLPTDPAIPFSVLFRDLGTRLTNAATNSDGTAKYPALPSEGDWTTEAGEDWYGIGFSLARYDQYAASTAGVQIELPVTWKDTSSKRAAFSGAFLPVLREFLAQFGVAW